MSTEQSQAPASASTTSAPIEGPSADVVERIFSAAGMPDPLALEPVNFDQTWRLAVIIADSGLYGIANVNHAFVLLQSGKELGMTAMQSLRGLYSFDGRLSMYADTMVSLVRRSKLCRRWRLRSVPTFESVTIETIRSDDPEHVQEVTWTIQQAAEIIVSSDGMRLSEKDNWKAQPRVMLRHRAEAELARQAYPEVILGLHTPEEMESIVARVDAQQFGTSAGRSRVVSIASSPAAAASVVVAGPATHADGRPLAFGERPPGMAPPPNADELKAAFDTATTKEQIDAICKRTPKHFRAILRPALAAANKRIEDAAAAATVAAAAAKIAEEAQASAAAAEKAKAEELAAASKREPETRAGETLPTEPSEDQVLSWWVERVLLIDAEPAKIATRHALKLREVPAALRAICERATVRRLLGLKESEQSAAELIAAAVRDAATIASMKS
jgi:hypothetical protein